MHQSFLGFSSGHITILTLFSVSAFGPQLCIYEYTTSTQQLTPHRILPDLDLVTDIVPLERWEFDVIKEGEAEFKEVIANVKAIAANV